MLESRMRQQTVRRSDNVSGEILYCLGCIKNVSVIETSTPVFSDQSGDYKRRKRLRDETETDDEESRPQKINRSEKHPTIFYSFIVNLFQALQD